LANATPHLANATPPLMARFAVSAVGGSGAGGLEAGVTEHARNHYQVNPEGVSQEVR
jgi:hypothetical protein